MSKKHIPKQWLWVRITGCDRCLKPKQWGIGFNCDTWVDNPDCWHEYCIQCARKPYERKSFKSYVRLRRDVVAWWIAEEPDKYGSRKINPVQPGMREFYKSKRTTPLQEYLNQKERTK